MIKKYIEAIYIEAMLVVKLEDLGIRDDNEYLIKEKIGKYGWEINQWHIHFYVSSKEDYMKAEENMEIIKIAAANYWRDVA